MESTGFVKEEVMKDPVTADGESRECEASCNWRGAPPIT
jgi:hypothetical protein